MNENKTTADWVANQLVSNGIKKVFLYPGGTIAPLINSFVQAKITLECFKTEQGAAYAALAYARLTGTVQVVMVTSGPGVTNVMTPLADAYYDSTPLVLITGQVGTGDLSSRENVRQRGFQETPTVKLTQPISKRSVCVLTPDKVFRELPRAFHDAGTGRKGPCVIDFPMDVQMASLEKTELLPAISYESMEAIRPVLDNSIIQEIAHAGLEACRPVLMLGQGALTACAYEMYRHIAKKLDALVVTSFLGIGSFDNSCSCCLGYVGHTGHLVANLAVSECDFLLVLGSRLDVRQTGTVVDRFVPQGKVAWVDIDPHELQNPRVPVEWKVEADLVDFCKSFIEVLDSRQADSDKDWQKKMFNIKSQQIEDSLASDASLIQPDRVLSCLSTLMNTTETVVVTGVGCHQHWAARHLPFKPEKHQHLSSGGHGAMGYDLPSAIGAAIAYPDKTIICIVGDGSLYMNIQELASLRERKLNVKILTLNNSRLGLVSQFQLITWGEDPVTGDFSTSDFKEIAHGFGLAADKLEKTDDIEKKLNWFWNQPGPVLLDVSIDPSSDVTPLLLGGQTMDKMWMGRKG